MNAREQRDHVPAEHAKRHRCMRRAQCSKVSESVIVSYYRRMAKTSDKHFLVLLTMSWSSPHLASQNAARRVSPAAEAHSRPADGHQTAAVFGGMLSSRWRVPSNPSRRRLQTVSCLLGAAEKE